MRTDYSHNDYSILELIVNNHPGVMSHISGLFSRRAFNVDGIICIPIASSENSRILLRVQKDARLPQVERQLSKLYDVQQISYVPKEHTLFDYLKAYY